MTPPERTPTTDEAARELAAVIAAIQAYLDRERAVARAPARSPAWRNAQSGKYRAGRPAGPRSWREAA